MEYRLPFTIQVYTNVFGGKMFGKRLTIFKLLGFEIKIDFSWIIIAILITWSLAEGVFPLHNKTLAKNVYWIMGIAGAIGLFLSIIFHELSHSIVARRFGLPMKGITLFIFGGVAEMDEEPKNPKAEFYMAIAGPLASILLGLLLFGLNRLGKLWSWNVSANMVLSYLGTINLILAGFNLIPAFPLDGGRVLRSILWNRKKNLKSATRIASNVGSSFGFFLIFLGIFLVLAGGIVGGIWWVMIGLFLRNASKTSYQSILIKTILDGEPIQRFMKENPVVVSPLTTIEDLIENYIYKYHLKMYPVVQNTNLNGCVDLDSIKNIPKDKWKQLTVDKLMKPCTSDNTINAADDSVRALSVMNKTGNSRLIVVDKTGSLAGIIALNDLLEFISIKLNLEK